MIYHGVPFYFPTGNCYSKVRTETEEMQKAMNPQDFYYNSPQAQVRYVYEGEKKIPQGKEYLVEMEKPRPDWWSQILPKKSNAR